MNREIAVSLGQARDRAGNPSIADVRDQLRDLIGNRLCPSYDSIRRLHRPDEIGAGIVDVNLLVGLAIIYNVPLSDIHPMVEDEATRLRVLLDRVTHRGDPSEESGDAGVSRFPGRRRINVA